MPTFAAADGAHLSYRESGEGEPWVVVPGGPGRDAAYLGDLGGLAAATGRRLVVLEPRGTGASPAPADPRGYTAEQVAEDLEHLRRHLGVDAMDVVTHSAGSAVGFLYARGHADRLRRLVLLNPSSTMIGLSPTAAETGRQTERRRQSSWFDEAAGALALAASIGWTDAVLQQTAPFRYARWSADEREHAAAEPTQRNQDARTGYWTGPTDRAALRAELGSVPVSVDVVVGELDLSPGPTMGERIARVFTDARLHVLPGVAHHPWLDDRDAFIALMRDLG